MTQMQLEARLAQIEADFAVRIDEAASKVSDHRIAIDRINGEKEMIISKYKRELSVKELDIAKHKEAIIISEDVIRSLKTEKAQERAQAFAEWEKALQQ